MKNPQRLFIWVFSSSVVILRYECTVNTGINQFAHYHCDSVFTTQSILPNKNQLLNDIMILQEQLNEVKPDAQFIIQKELFHTLSNLAHQYGD